MPWRACALCERVLFQCRWLCEPCREHLQSKARAQQRALKLSGKFFPHSYLWLSGGRNEAQLSRLIHSFKGGAPSWALRGWVAHWVNTSETSFSERAVLVPAPARRAGARDHAARISYEISSLRRVPVAPVLQHLDGQRLQKRATLRERREIRFGFTGTQEDLSCIKSKDVHFVDDVVTTGSTAEAAWRALGRPHRFHVWSLIYRSRLLP